MKSEKLILLGFVLLTAALMAGCAVTPIMAPTVTQIGPMEWTGTIPVRRSKFK